MERACFFASQSRDRPNASVPAGTFVPAVVGGNWMDCFSACFPVSLMTIEFYHRSTSDGEWAADFAQRDLGFAWPARFASRMPTALSITICYVWHTFAAS